VFKTEAQALYSTLKGGQDAKSQQFAEIRP
jgi:hypothetical protein